MAVVDALLIVNCVAEFSIFNIFLGHQPNWYILAFPYFLHPLKVSSTLQLLKPYLLEQILIYISMVTVSEFHSEAGEIQYVLGPQLTPSKDFLIYCKTT